MKPLQISGSSDDDLFAIANTEAVMIDDCDSR